MINLNPRMINLNPDNMGPLLTDFGFRYQNFISQEDLEQISEIITRETGCDYTGNRDFHYCCFHGRSIVEWGSSNKEVKVKRLNLDNIEIVGLIGGNRSTITIYPARKLLSEMLLIGQLYSEQYSKSLVGQVNMLNKIRELRINYRGLGLLEAKVAVEMIWFYEENRP